MVVGPDADLARAVEAKYRWQPIGYRAAPFPMWPSISEAATNHLPDQPVPGPFALVGYSQRRSCRRVRYSSTTSSRPTACCITDCPTCARLSCSATPCGAFYRAWSDGVSLARTDASGILDDRLQDTPDWWRSYAHAADLYTDCELDDDGEWKRMVCKIVMGHNIFSGDDGVIAQVAEFLARLHR